MLNDLGEVVRDLFTCLPRFMPRPRIAAVKQAARADPKRLLRWDRYERKLLYWAETAVKSSRRPLVWALS